MMCWHQSADKKSASMPMMWRQSADKKSASMRGTPPAIVVTCALLWFAAPLASALLAGPPAFAAPRRTTRAWASSPEDLLAEAERLRGEAAAMEATMPAKNAFGRQDDWDALDEPSLDGATVVVAGANGRLGSAVCDALLERGCAVRGVIRSEEPEAYGRLSYAVGAESLVGTLEAPWILRDTSQGGPLFDSPATYAAPDDDSLADTSDADYAAMTPFGQNQVIAARAARKLRRFEMRVADLRDAPQVERAVAGADALVYCATSYDGTSDREVRDGAAALLRETGRLFELRLPRFDKVKEARADDAVAGSADVEGVENAAAALETALARRDKPNPTRPLAFLLVSAVDGFEGGGFLARKRTGEARLAAKATGANWAGALALRVPPLDDFVPEVGAPGGLFPGAESAKRLRPVNPRDLARTIAAALVDAELRSPGDFQVANYEPPAAP